MIDSPCLERAITDSILSFRLLGASEDIRAENSHLFCITANTPNVSRDLITRSVPINLHYEGDPANREFSIENPEGYAEDHRLELLSELLGMVERWKAAGMPLGHYKHRSNKRGWARIIGGILDECGEPDFLANYDRAVKEFDRTRQDMAELVVIMAKEPGRRFRPSELVSTAEGAELLAIDLGTGSAKSKETRMGNILSRFVNEVFPVNRESDAALVKREDRDGNVYQAELRSPLRNGAEG